MLPWPERPPDLFEAQQISWARAPILARKADLVDHRGHGIGDHSIPDVPNRREILRWSGYLHETLSAEGLLLARHPGSEDDESARMRYRLM